MIMGRGLVVTGALEPATRFLDSVWKINTQLGMLVSLLMAMLLSMMVNDTPVLVLLLPIFVALAERGAMAASKTLIPLECRGADRRHGHDHRHLDQPAGRLHRRGSGHGTHARVRFHAHRRHRRAGRAALSVAGDAAPAARPRHREPAPASLIRGNPARRRQFRADRPDSARSGRPAAGQFPVRGTARPPDHRQLAPAGQRLAPRAGRGDARVQGARRARLGDRASQRRRPLAAGRRGGGGNGDHAGIATCRPDHSLVGRGGAVRRGGPGHPPAGTRSRSGSARIFRASAESGRRAAGHGPDFRARGICRDRPPAHAGGRQGSAPPVQGGAGRRDHDRIGRHRQLWPAGPSPSPRWAARSRCS